jgi:glucose/arabinose dehydrogenase
MDMKTILLNCGPRKLARAAIIPRCGTMRAKWTLMAVCLLAGAGLLRSADLNRMDHGPFVSWTIDTDPLTYKGIAVRVNSDPPAVLLFDTDLLRVSAAWTGGFLRWHPHRDGLERWPTPVGSFHFINEAGPGWSRTGTFEDPRPLPHGPVPEDWARHQGLYLHGNQVLLSHTVGECQVLELPGFAQVQDQPIFTRAFNLSASADSLSLRILRVPDGVVTFQENRASNSKGHLRVQGPGEERLIGFDGIPAGANWRIANRHLCLELPPLRQPLRFRLAIGPALRDANSRLEPAFAAYIQGMPPLPDLDELRRPGPPRWLPVLETQAATGTEEGPFAVDTLTLPETNPWNSWLRLTGLDFLSDGRAVVTSVSGDVWLVSGIAENLGTLRWKRFATGLNQPLGIKIVEDRIYVAGRDQITLLHDANGDGEADYYENFNNQTMAGENFHEFTMNLETDSRGNFYFSKGTPWPPARDGRLVPFTPHNGVLFQLSPDGRRLAVFATGLRYPNGLAISPSDEILYTDNEGNWVPTSVLHRIRPNGFYGFQPSVHRPEMPEKFEPPITWLPHAVDNSPGSPIFVTSDQWGPLKGSVLLTSYGKGTLSLVLNETVDGRQQGGFLNLPLQFQSGIMRGRFHSDGHLYLCGMRSWQSAGIRFGAFHRVRSTGRPLHLPLALNVKRNGIQLRFSDELNPEEAADVENYSIEQWNYRWIERYGSPAFSVKNPDQEGSDPVAIRSVRLSPDRKTVLLEVPDLQPVMQMRIAYILEAADGTEMRHQIYNTIHRVPPEQGNQ